MIEFRLSRGAALFVMSALFFIGFVLVMLIVEHSQEKSAREKVEAALSEVPAAVIEEGVTAVYFDSDGTEEAKVRWAEAGIQYVPTCFLIETTDTAHYLCVSDDGMESEHFTS